MLRILGGFSSMNKVAKSINVSNCMFMRNYSFTFNEAKNALSQLKEEPDNTTKLKIYALFKQASEGPCNKPKPGMMDFVGKAKWEAWNDLKQMSKTDAEAKYIELISSLVKNADQSESSAASSTVDSKYEGLNVVKQGSAAYLYLNRPNKKNAITWTMYKAWVQALEDLAKDDSVTVVAITGTGDFFCSGNDLSNFTKGGDVEQMIKEAKMVLQNFVAAFIDFPKPLIGLINGPAIGISVTTLALYDMVIASDKATFHTPLPQLGQVPEGCSSYTFPKIMGFSKASSMLLFNKKITAEQAIDYGLVSQVIPHSDFEAQTKSLVSIIAKQPPIATRQSKELLRAGERAVLHKVNQAECQEIAVRWASDECRNAIMSFFAKK